MANAKEDVKVTATDVKEAQKAQAAEIKKEKIEAKTKEQRDKEIADAHAEVVKLDKVAEEKRLVADGKLSKEQVEANKARQDADDARAELNRLQTDVGPLTPADVHTIAEAKTLGYGKPEDLPAGSHFAQKFGNDPANPKPAPGLPEQDSAKTVRLSRTTPDSREKVYSFCHPDMVGDNLRAGWNRDEIQVPQVPPEEDRDQVEHNQKLEADALG
jgi:hypothetical protein